MLVCLATNLWMPCQRVVVSDEARTVAVYFSLTPLGLVCTFVFN